MKPAAPVLIVDGHSMVFAWPELARLHRRNQVAGRDELVRRLTRYADAAGSRVVVVFDGRGDETTEEEAGPVQIFYAARGRTADAVIERLVALYADARQITVATDDSHEQVTVSAFGAHWVSAAGLADLLRAAAGDFERVLRKYRRLPGRP